MKRLPLNSSKFLWKAPDHEGKSKIDEPSRQEPNKGPVEFDTKFLQLHIGDKSVKRLNIRGQNLVSSSERERWRSVATVENVCYILADDNQLNLADFQMFPNVSILSLRSNRLNRLKNFPIHNSGDSKHFHSLSRIDLSYNRLESTSLKCLNQLTSLVELRLNSNQIKFFTDANNLNNLSKLVRLELCSNGIESCKIFHHLSSLRCLQELLLNNNHLRCIPFLLRSETAEKLNRITGEHFLHERTESCINGINQNVQNTTSCESVCSSVLSSGTSSSSSESQTCSLLENLYQPQTRDVLGSFRPRTLSTLYEGSEHDTLSSEHSSTESDASEDIGDEVIPIGHVPFPQLHSLQIKFNEFSSVRSILGATLWPNMKSVYVRGNQVTDDVDLFDVFAKSNIVVHYT